MPRTSELVLVATRSRSRENNTQLFSYTLAPFHYALCAENANSHLAEQDEIESEHHNEKTQITAKAICVFLNTANNMDTTADAVQKAVRTVTLNFFRRITVDYYTIFNSPKLIGSCALPWRA